MFHLAGACSNGVGMFVLDHEGRLPAELRHGAAALGNFDGVHLGHKAVIAAARAIAAKTAGPTIVATFDPHPARFFRPDVPPFALTSRAQKLEILAGLGVDAVAIIPFNRELASLSPEAFAEQWLVSRLGIRHAVTGTDFTFGRNRSGDVHSLAALGRKYGYGAETIGPVRHEGEVVSSTRIRQALAEADIQLATRMQTRPFAIRARVIHGDKRGRSIGVPTANQQLGDYTRPKYGVYAVRVRLPDGHVAAGVANIGIRPMFEPPRELLETWILDWSGDLYGQEIEVALIDWLRPEIRFDGLEALKAQIAEDAAQARDLLQA